MCELLQDASLGKDLSQRTATAQEIIQENHRLEPMRLETYCAASKESELNGRVEDCLCPLCTQRGLNIQNI